MGILVGIPTAEDQTPRGMMHEIPWPDEASILIFLEGNEKRFPILNRIIRSQYGPEGVFGMDRSAQLALLAEIDYLRREMELDRLQPETREKVRSWALRNKGRCNTEGISPEAALYGLVKLGEFVHKVVDLGWYLLNDTE